MSSSRDQKAGAKVRCASERPSTPVGALLAFGAALAWVVLVRLPLPAHNGPDDAFYSEVASLWRQGVLPYIGAFDVKPPGFFVVLALAQACLGSNFAALYAVAIVSDAATAAMLMILGMRFGQPIVGLFAAGVYPILSATVIADPAYGLLAAATTSAVFAAVSSKPVLARAAVAGLTIGAACVVKQTAAFEGLAILAILVAAADAGDRRLRLGVVYAAAAAVVPIATLVYFATHDGAGALLSDVVAVALQRASAASMRTGLLDGPWRLAILSIVYAPLIAGVLLVGGRLELRRSRAPSWALRLWLAAALASALAQRALSATYFGPVLAPALLLTGLVIAAKMNDPSTWRLGTVLAALSAALLVYSTVERAETLVTTDDMPAIEVTAASIRAERPKDGDRLYVVFKSAWLYSIAGLRPPTPFFIPSQSLCQFANVGPTRLVEAFEARPRFVVVGNPSQAFDCEAPEAPRAISAALARDYRFVKRVQGSTDTYDLYETRVNSPPRDDDHSGD